MMVNAKKLRTFTPILHWGILTRYVASSDCFEHFYSLHNSTATTASSKAESETTTNIPERQKG